MATPLTTPTRRVLRHLLDTHGDCFGADLGRVAGLPSGAVYPTLAELELRGWLVSRWTDDGPAARRVYRLTEEGRARGWNALQSSAEGASR